MKSGNVQTGQLIGYLDMSNSFSSYVLKTSLGDFSSSALSGYISANNMQLYGCYIFNYELDLDLPENSAEVLNVNKYYTITILGFVELDKYSSNSYISDTSRVMTDELPIADPVSYLDYKDSYIFMQHGINHAADLQIAWDLSYDYMALSQTPSQDGNRYYDVFLRATKKNTTSKTTTSDYVYLVAYQTDNVLSYIAGLERSALGSSYNTQSTFNLRVNYPSAISESGVITWSSKTVKPYIASFISEQ
jgi:hypothetical protein